MKTYQVGERYPEFMGHEECVQFDLADDGAVLLVYFDRPSDGEVLQFRSGKGLELRMTELYGVIFLAVKVGSLSWMDAPYTPHLSKNLTRVEMPEDGQGLACQLILIDTATGEIKHIRLLGLSTKFTRELFAAVAAQMERPFDKERYFDTIGMIYGRYGSDAIARMSGAYCKF